MPKPRVKRKRNSLHVVRLADSTSHCDLCPRRCGVNRGAGELGFCRAGSRVQLFRYGPHYGEEPPISADRGSGTLFFSRCTLRCGYCQNYPWSQEGLGDEYGQEGLGGVLDELRALGCHNWNLVSPTPWLAQVVPLLKSRKADGHALPVVYNSSGFERPEVLRELDDVVDVYLMDLRYSSPQTAEALSGADDYVDVARAAIREAWRQKGPLCCDSDGVAMTGCICRILVLPGHADEAVDSLKWLAETCGTDMPVSLMAQYRSVYRAAQGSYGDVWMRGVTREEYERVVAQVESCEFSEGWIQEWSDTSPGGLLGCEMSPGCGDAGAAGDTDIPGDVLL